MSYIEMVSLACSLHPPYWAGPVIFKALPDASSIESQASTLYVTRQPHQLKHYRASKVFLSFPLPSSFSYHFLHLLMASLDPAKISAPVLLSPLSPAPPITSNCLWPVVHWVIPQSLPHTARNDLSPAAALPTWAFSIPGYRAQVQTVTQPHGQGTLPPKPARHFIMIWSVLPASSQSPLGGRQTHLLLSREPETQHSETDVLHLQAQDRPPPPRAFVLVNTPLPRGFLLPPDGAQTLCPSKMLFHLMPSQGQVFESGSHKDFAASPSHTTSPSISISQQ